MAVNGAQSETLRTRKLQREWTCGQIPLQAAFPRRRHGLLAERLDLLEHIWARVIVSRLLGHALDNGLNSRKELFLLRSSILGAEGARQSSQHFRFLHLQATALCLQLCDLPLETFNGLSLLGQGLFLRGNLLLDLSVAGKSLLRCLVGREWGASLPHAWP